MSGIYLAHSILIGSAIGYAVESGSYGFAAGAFAVTVFQLLWGIQDK